jgi:hypothetical protein
MASLRKQQSMKSVWIVGVFFCLLIHWSLLKDERITESMRRSRPRCGLLAQVGVGEYTYKGTHQYHGIAIMKFDRGRISEWREYQYESDRPFGCLLARASSEGAPRVLRSDVPEPEGIPLSNSDGAKYVWGNGTAVARDSALVLWY